ncbi:AMP-binding protein [Streptacidiphilus jiangxiensis]|uniref:Amino acid adenylation domain-containing protein n=1 Tax=Streptacidiphilus jiangxiensis TaxID=235985 RepID=A0A1H7P9D4_STRJI|nr:AMP-binding protein [Streptacidiphilus jiangxiensis]SEL32410.1 amino acid adenylation domain-containing protein [Streptacidiphilus jiangxiensis]
MSDDRRLDFRLSPAQERLWFLHRLDPQDTAYHVYWNARLRGTLHRPVLEAALADLAERHEPLRTVYVDDEGVARGRVRPAGVPLDLVDLSGSADPQAMATRELRRRLDLPFDLCEQPPVRLGLLRLGPEDHVLSLVVHHIAADGWSLDLWAAELADRYESLLAGRQDQPPALARPFHRHAELLRERAAADRAHWLRELDGAPALAPAGTRPEALAADGDSAGAFHPVPLPHDAQQRVRELARAERTSVFVVLLSAFQVLVARWAGTTDVCVGTPLACRDELETEPLFGYLSSTVVLRAELGDRPSFRDLMRRNRSRFFAAYAHPQVPFEELPRDPAGPYQAMFVLGAGAPTGSMRALPGLAVTPFGDGLHRVKAPLTLEGHDRMTGTDGLTLLLGHRLSLFDHAAGRELARHLATLVDAATRTPDQPVDLLPLLTSEEHNRLLALARGPHPEAPALDVSELFAAQAARTPAAAAVHDRGRAWSYAELAELVRGETDRLRAAGCGPGRVVAVRRERSVHLVAALLAILATGAAYTGLHPNDPPARVDALLAGSGADLLLDEDGPRPATPATSGPPAGPGLAYLCHTSGTTGAPKAVMVTREGLAARVRWMGEEYRLGPGDRVLQFASPAFDTHAEEIFPALTRGAALVLLPGGGELLPDFLRTADGASLTVLDLPTSYWHALAAEPATAWPPGLRLLVVGGETAHAGAVAAWRRAVGPGPRLVNTYGPTEATVVATACDVFAAGGGVESPGVGHGQEIGAGTVVPQDMDPPIGRPLADTEAHVLDSRMRPVPVGTPGELYLGGAGLARGYRGDPARTADRFRPDPYGPPGSRLYATGDLALWLPDGRLRHLGRIDDQVKVRGLRVEPAGIERVLCAHPAVTAAAVTVVDQALTTFVVTGLDDLSALHDALAAALPSRLLPVRLRQVERLPLTGTGKVDRAALAALAAVPAARDADLPDGRSGWSKPRDEAEELVAAVWSGVLGCGPLGPEADFFLLGGHSLHALRVAARLSATVDVEIPVRVLFEHRTLAGLAAAVRALVLDDIDRLTDDEVAESLGRTPTA